MDALTATIPAAISAARVAMRVSAITGRLWALAIGVRSTSRMPEHRVAVRKTLRTLSGLHTRSARPTPMAPTRHQQRAQSVAYLITGGPLLVRRTGLEPQSPESRKILRQVPNVQTEAVKQPLVLVGVHLVRELALGL